MTAYINGIGIISPQNTWQNDNFLSSPVSSKSNYLACVEPDYTALINPAQLRRMSRILKMGNAAATIALKQAGISVPDGVITGTGFGCLEDTATFLSKITTLNETALNPTPFMQSTHNTIGSQIALSLQCQGYNQTYVHDSFAFEHSLLDALMFLDDSPGSHLLVGGVDEVTQVSHDIKSRFGIYKNGDSDSLQLFSNDTGRTIEGEGASYFVLSGKRQDNSFAKIDGVRTYYGVSQADIISTTEEFLKSHGLQTHDVDLLIVGKSGDHKNDLFADTMMESLFDRTAVAGFKHLSGEYCVASSFATWMAAKAIESQSLPAVARLRGNPATINHVLIYNPYFYNHHSLILLSTCHATLR